MSGDRGDDEHTFGMPRSRRSQLAELGVRSFQSKIDETGADGRTSTLFLFVKDSPLGPGYVADFVFTTATFPLTVKGVLIHTDAGLAIAELELFRTQWGYFDDWGDYVGPNGKWRGADDEGWDVSALAEPAGAAAPFRGVTGAVLRDIPIGQILSMARRELVDDTWRTEGITMLTVVGARQVPADALSDTDRAALERAAAVHTPRRGRPPISDEHLADVAQLYVTQLAHGRGVHRRMADHYGRPVETVRHWIHLARKRGYLTATEAGRSGGRLTMLAIERSETP